MLRYVFLRSIKAFCVACLLLNFFSLKCFARPQHPLTLEFINLLETIFAKSNVERNELSENHYLVRSITQEIQGLPFEHHEQKELYLKILMIYVNEPNLFVEMKLHASPKIFSQASEGEKNIQSNFAPGTADFQSETHLLEALVSDEVESEKWASRANISATYGKITSTSQNFSAQVKVEFMGSTLQAGPEIKFKKALSTWLDIKGEGLHPLFDAQGNFDYLKRHKDGRPQIQNGKPKFRFMFFTCEAEVQIDSELVTSGGFRVVGLGGEVALQKEVKTRLNFSSRRVLVPRSINNRPINLTYLLKLCQNQFLHHPTSNGKSVTENIKQMSRDFAYSLIYVNPQTACVVHEDCSNNQTRSDMYHRTVKLCLPDKNNPLIKTCQKRGVQESFCPRPGNNQPLKTENALEVECAPELSCLLTAEGGWFQGGFIYQRPIYRCQK